MKLDLENITRKDLIKLCGHQVIRIQELETEIKKLRGINDECIEIIFKPTFEEQYNFYNTEDLR